MRTFENYAAASRRCRCKSRNRRAVISYNTIREGEDYWHFSAFGPSRVLLVRVIAKNDNRQSVTVRCQHSEQASPREVIPEQLYDEPAEVLTEVIEKEMAYWDALRKDFLEIISLENPDAEDKLNQGAEDQAAIKFSREQ